MTASAISTVTEPATSTQNEPGRILPGEPSRFDVAVVVTTCNRPDYLPQTLDSVLAQRYEGKVEIVVVDDGSKDHTRSVVEPYVKKYADENGLRVVRYVFQENQGLACARNTGVYQSSAPLICFVDDDDICEPDKLALQTQALAADPQTGLCHTSFRYIDHEGNFTSEAQRLDNPCVGMCVQVLLKELLVISSTVMARREVIAQAAAAEPHGLPYDPRWVRSQDYDFALRMARISRFAYLPVSLLRYRFHSGNIAMSKGNIKRAFGFHCKVQMDFAKRWGGEIGVNEQQAREYVATFLHSRATSCFWKRELDTCGELCDLAGELGVSDDRFKELKEKAQKPAWMYHVKDAVDRWRGK